MRRSKPHQNQQPSGAEPPPENPAHPKNPMENFRALVMTMAMNCTPNKSLSPAQKIFVHQKLQECFPDSKPSPDHPPYSWMILKAIENLNEEGGSTEEAISKYIVKENSNLPWAHATLLSHHIGKLCESNEIFETVDGYFALSYPITNICTTSSPNECISSKHSSDKKRKNPKNMQKKDSKKRKRGYMVVEEEEEINLEIDVQLLGLDGSARKEPNEQMQQDLMSEERNEEQQPNCKQGQQKGRRLGILPKRRIKKVVQEEENNLEIDGQPLRFEDGARNEPNKQMRQDFVSEKCRGGQLIREQELEKGKRRSSRVPKRNRKNNDLEEQTNTEIHALEEPNEQIQQDLASEECNKDEEQQLNMEQGKRKQGKPHKNVVEELTNLESDFQPQELDDAQNENEQMQHLQKGKRKLGKRQQHLQLQTCTPKTKSSEGLSMKPSARSLQSSNQKSLHLAERKHIKHEGSAEPQEIRRSTRISIATSKKKEYKSAT